MIRDVDQNISFPLEASPILYKKNETQFWNHYSEVYIDSALLDDDLGDEDEIVEQKDSFKIKFKLAQPSSDQVNNVKGEYVSALSAPPKCVSGKKRIFIFDNGVLMSKLIRRFD